jgi:hypothetical protein
VTALALLWSLRPAEHVTAEYSHPVLENDATTLLQQRIERGDVHLDFDEDRGYLRSLLEQFDIPVSSQTLVFSKSSFQLDLISPRMPRAIYFNDDVYVGWVQGGRVIEVTSVDPNLGPLFYTLSQEEAERPVFVRQANECLVCHDAFSNPEMVVPRLLVLSVLPNPAGNALKAESMLTTDRSPFRERWGGWYVTGSHGGGHLGNVTVRTPAAGISSIRDYIKTMDLAPGANVRDLTDRFDTSPYLTAHSDIVALMVLAHQTHVHNLITLASYEILKGMEKPVGEAENAPNLPQIVKDATEPLVQAMLFSEAAPLPGPIAGTTTFAADFVRDARRDKQGRSLRDLDLEHRLFRYPLSYLIYSASFDAMPAPARDYVVQRLGEILTGQDQSEGFAHLSPADRQAILEILRETKADFANLRP